MPARVAARLSVEPLTCVVALTHDAQHAFHVHQCLAAGVFDGRQSLLGQRGFGVAHSARAGAG